MGRGVMRVLIGGGMVGSWWGWPVAGPPVRAAGEVGAVAVAVVAEVVAGAGAAAPAT